MVSTQGDFCAVFYRVFGVATRDVLSSSFATRTKESNTCASFCSNAWICAPLTTDRDPANVNFNKIWNICDVCNFMRTYCFSN